jgi:hypothetical protein
MDHSASLTLDMPTQPVMSPWTTVDLQLTYLTR